MFGPMLLPTIIVALSMIVGPLLVGPAVRLVRWLDRPAHVSRYDRDPFDLENDR